MDCQLSDIPAGGTVMFSGPTAIWHQTSDWPLQAGTYRAYMLQNNAAANFWPVLAQSEIFTITSTATTANDLALSHLTAARTEIESLISNDSTLAPKFLRMSFHDCIGGCDGTLPLTSFY
jgi:hypothetical protein